MSDDERKCFPFYLWRVLIADRVPTSEHPQVSCTPVHVIAITAQSAIENALRHRTSPQLGHPSALLVQICERLLVVDIVATSVITECRMREAILEVREGAAS